MIIGDCPTCVTSDQTVEWNSRTKTARCSNPDCPHPDAVDSLIRLHPEFDEFAKAPARWMKAASA